VNIIVIDNNILDVLFLQDDDKLPLNSLHILEECNIPAIRCSQDKHKIDKYGNRLLDLCRSLELFFVNGRVGTDRGIGQPTALSVADLIILLQSFTILLTVTILVFWGLTAPRLINSSSMLFSSRLYLNTGIRSPHHLGLTTV
jgi:hypothetical protein